MNSDFPKAVLSVHGGAAVRTAQVPAWPSFPEDEISAVVEVMRSGRVNYCTGEQGRRFEREFADSCGVKHAVAVANGTVAIELGLRSVGIGPGDHVITSSRTFVATASSIALLGATPIFADVDRNTQNITVETILEVLTPETRAILVVHLGGNPCDMDPIVQLAAERKLFLIEDCAQAQGATYRGRPVGSFGDAGAFSFCNDKIMSSIGEGGMLTTNSDELWEWASAFRNHGIRPSASGEPANGNGYRWIHDSIGTNWRMAEVLAAVGRKHLAKMPGWLDRRRELANTFRNRLSQIPALRVPIIDPHANPSFYRFYAFVRPERLKEGWHRDAIVRAINAENGQCFTGSCGEVYLEKALAPWRPDSRRPVARELGETSLAFLVHHTLTEADVKDVCRAVEKVMTHASSTA